ncbi:MAG: peptide deformylase [Epsilonproteobacteria bacterium]|nr:peptide deformylase [Campylobacterota bacterium]
MIYNILVYPDKKLREVSKNVKKFDDKLHILLNDMYETMIAKEGIGLAAIQIGITKNILLINLADDDGMQKKEDMLEVINPKITHLDGSEIYQEGCLSVPGFYEDVKRAKNITVEYFDRFGNKTVQDLEGLPAIAMQHEMDHLKGHLFIEKLSYLKRKKFEKEWKKKLKSEMDTK